MWKPHPNATEASKEIPPKARVDQKSIHCSLPCWRPQLPGLRTRHLSTSYLSECGKQSLVRNLNNHNYLPGSPNTCYYTLWPLSCHDLTEIKNMKWNHQIWKSDLWFKLAVIKPDKDNLAKDCKWYHASLHGETTVIHLKILHFTFSLDENKSIYLFLRNSMCLLC